MSLLASHSSTKPNSRLFSLRTWTRSTISKQVVSRIRSLEDAAGELSDHQIQGRSQELREQFLELKRPNHREEATIEYSGLIAESVFRELGFRLHDVQVQAIVAGSKGAIVEMQTGEGKTVVTGSTAALQCLAIPSVHVATTNPYLAARDLEELKPVFERLGMSASLLTESNDAPASKRAYQSSITYGPGYQYGFDFLKDQVFLRSNRQSRLGQKTLNDIRGVDINERLMQPADYHSMLVDEADSVMIDEAVTPLVISGAARGVEDPKPFQLAQQIAGSLVENTDFTIEKPNSKIEINDKADENFHNAIASLDLDLARPWRIYISNALRAKHVLKRNVDYVVRDGEIQIVDQYTGRIFTDRTWQDGLHQAVECKEGVKIMSAPPSVARVTRQRYFQKYDQLSGLTGTASTVANEFSAVYGTKVIRIPTNLACIRNNFATRFFADMQSKLAAIATDVAARHQTGQPILIGTRTIAESILVHDELNKQNLSAIVLNGLQDDQEAEIVSRAGTVGAITIATNMAGRGTDIKPSPESIEAGGLHVVGFCPNGSSRIDRQLIGRAARQGNPGSSQFFVSSDDEVVTKNSSSLAKKISRRSNKNGECTFNLQNELTSMQNAIEARNFESRRAMMRQDNWMDMVRETIDKE